MLYFKTVNIENVDPEVIEKAIREYSLIQNKPIDFRDSEFRYYRSKAEGKYFFGSEDYNKLLVRRIQPPVELILPRLIVRLYKADKFTSYKVRYSYPCIAFFCLIIVQVVAELMYRLTTGRFPYQPLFITGTILVLIPFLTRIELRKTRRAINEVIEKACPGIAPEQAFQHK